jgi:hypothetical protein
MGEGGPSQTYIKKVRKKVYLKKYTGFSEKCKARQWPPIRLVTKVLLSGKNGG